MKIVEVLAVGSKRQLFALCLVLIFSSAAFAQTDKPKEKSPAPAPTASSPAQRPSSRLSLGERQSVTLADLNVEILADNRVIAMMAALNAAGFDFEPGNRQLSGLRQQLRTDLQTINPSLARRLRDYFISHSAKISGGRTDASAVAPYLSLALTMTAPPTFSIDSAVEKLPEDVREITDFALLLEEFYRETKFSTLMPKYAQAYAAAAKTYPTGAASAVANVIQYLHTDPILELPPLYKQRVSVNNKLPETSLKSANRIRRFVILPDLLNSSNAVNLRVIQDTYYVFLGSSVDAHTAVRRSFLRFVLDPIVEKQVQEVRDIGPDLRKLAEARGDKLAPEYKNSNAFFQIADSLMRAVDTRLDSLEAIIVQKFADDKAFIKALEDENERAIYELSFAYERGAVLVYHFYEQMKQAEDAGIDVRQYLSSMLQNIKFDQETARLTDNAQRIERYKVAREAAAKNAPNLSTSISNADKGIIAKLDQADQLVRMQQFNDARTILRGVLQESPNNARAYYGLAEIGSKIAVKIEDQSKRDEELYASVQYYKDAATNASQETEKWLIQRSYVAAAKILEFLDQPGDADAAYDLAIKMGDIPNGAYQDAVKAVKTKQEQKKPE